MGNEITVGGSLAYSDADGSQFEIALSGLLATAGSKKFVRARQNIGTTEEAIGLGEVTSPGWGIFVNRDATNFIHPRVGTGGSRFARLRPGKFAILELGADITAPFAIADTGACDMDYAIVSA